MDLCTGEVIFQSQVFTFNKVEDQEYFLHNSHKDVQMPFENQYNAAEIKLGHLLKETESDDVPTQTPKPAIKINNTAAKKPIDFSRLDVRVGKIISIQEVVTAQNLYVEEVDVGESVTRTVISGLVDHISMNELENRRVIVLCNLKPRRMRGYVSEGMLLCAGSASKIEVLEPPFGSRPGEKVIVAGYNGTADKVLNPKLKIFETVALHLRVNEEKVATYKGVPLQVVDKGFIKTESLTNVSIL